MPTDDPHDDSSVYVTSGLADNGHTRRWAVCSTCYWCGPFRATYTKAQADADAHLRRVGREASR